MIPEHTAAALDALDPDLAARLRFVLEADSLKTVLRRNSLTDGSRRENSGEHSWHLALMALVLAPHSDEPDRRRAASSRCCSCTTSSRSTPATRSCTTPTHAQQKEELELRAADRLFAMIPGDAGTRLRAAVGRVRSERRRPRRGSRTPSTGSRRCCSTTRTAASSGRSTGSPPTASLAYNAHIADGSTDLWTAGPRRARRRDREGLVPVERGVRSTRAQSAR